MIQKSFKEGLEVRCSTELCCSRLCSSLTVMTSESLRSIALWNILLIIVVESVGVRASIATTLSEGLPYRYMV
jgi:hypothetical protein